MSTKAIEQFLQTAYTDEKLAALLAHAQDGKLAWFSCCCLVGAANATHALRGQGMLDGGHYSALSSKDTMAVELEFLSIGNDEKRRAVIIPLILAEMDRRDSLEIPADKGDNTRSLEECFVPVLTERF